MIEMTVEALNRVILNAYNAGMEQGLIRNLAGAAVAQQDQKAWQPKHEATREFRAHMSDEVVKEFWTNLPQNEIKWSALSYRAKNEITDTIKQAVIASLTSYFGDAK